MYKQCIRSCDVLMTNNRSSTDIAFVTDKNSEVIHTDLIRHVLGQCADLRDYRINLN